MKTAPSTGGPLQAGPIFERSVLEETGAVFKWDASGPASGMAALVSERLEFAYLALDARPAVLYVKKSKPGVTPIVWAIAQIASEFSLTELNNAEASANASQVAAAASAAISLANKNVAVISALQSAASAAIATMAADETEYLASLVGDLSYDMGSMTEEVDNTAEFDMGNM